jgi:putative transcriptional regulator
MQFVCSISGNKPKFKSDAFEAIHSSATALRRVGAIKEDSKHEFDVACLAEPESVSAEHVKKIHEENRRSGAP